MKAVRSSSQVVIVPSLSSSSYVFASPVNSEEFVNMFVRIGFGSVIKLVSFDKSQVVTFNSKFIRGFRNSDYRMGVGATTWSAAHMGSSSIG
ncbi:hypothetical protein Tco_1542599 [Tanacetum coccineum]